MKSGGLVAVAIVLAITFMFMGTSASADILAAGSDADSSSTTSDSGLQIIGGDITLLRGCTDGQGLVWDETNDDWDCGSVSGSILSSGSDGDSSTTQSDSGLELVGGDITMLRGCADNQILKWDETADDWNCEADNAGGGSAVILDLGDDASNESTDLQEIATTGDTNSIFGEPSADKLLITVSNNWPTADAADALSADPANCSAGQVAGGVTAAGVAESCLDPITETELDSEAELEAQLTGVSNVFTNNDGALADDNVTDDNIDSLANVDITAAAAGELLIYDGTNSWDDKALSGDCTITAGGVIECTQADALEANGANCSAGNAPLGVDASGAVEGCWAAEAEAHNSDHATGGADTLLAQHRIVWLWANDVPDSVPNTNDMIFNLPVAATFVEAHCVLGTAAAGSAVTVQFQEDGTDIMTDGNRVSIAAAGTEDDSSTFSDSSGAADANITAIIEATDSGDAAADLTCWLWWKTADLTSS